uniref:Uncharacterized protein n=1 Tax=Nothoprocta perdicaria TaxID=30464 RepID=A0A8C6Z6Z2_NOTPE
MHGGNGGQQHGLSGTGENPSTHVGQKDACGEGRGSGCKRRDTELVRMYVWWVTGNWRGLVPEHCAGMEGIQDTREAERSSVCRQTGKGLARWVGELLGWVQEEWGLHRVLGGWRGRGSHTLRQEGSWESHWTHVQTTAAQKTLLLGQIRMAVLNLFQLATKQLKVPADAALEDTEAQLDTVLLCMQDLAAIRAELCPGEPAAASKRLPPASSRE